MSKSRLNQIFASAITAIVIWCACSSTCRAQISNDRDTILTSTRDFLEASYPELSGRSLLLSLHIKQSLDTPWRQIHQMSFEVTLYDPRSEKLLNPPFDAKTGERLPPPENSVLLQGNIFFNRQGRLHQFSVGDCILAHSKENGLVRDGVESHPEWTEAQAFASLRRAGARYGPENKDEFLKTIRLQNYEKFLGHFNVKTVEFEGLTEPHEGNFASLSWRMRLDVESSGGKHSAYTLVFEPFEGKLTQVLHGLTGTLEETAPTKTKNPRNP